MDCDIFSQLEAMSPVLQAGNTTQHRTRQSYKSASKLKGLRHREQKDEKCHWEYLQEMSSDFSASSVNVHT